MIKDENLRDKLQAVYIVVCFNNICGVYADSDDAHQCQQQFIQKNRPADVLCRPITYPLKSN